MVLPRIIPAIGLLTTQAILLISCQSQPPKQARIQVPEAPPCTNQTFTSEALFSEAKRGVAVVITDDGEGSGFIVRHQDGNTLLISNSQVAPLRVV